MQALDYRIVVHLAFPVRMAVIVVICFCALALILVSGLIFPLLVRFPGTLRDTVINAVLLSIAHLPKMLLVTAMNLLPLLLLVLLPRLVLFFGFLWPLVRQRRGLWRTVLAAFLLSLCIELLQPLLTTNRTSDITDVIANTAGGLVGYLLFLPFGSRLLHFCGAEDRPRNVDEMPASADDAKNGEGENQDKF